MNFQDIIKNARRWAAILTEDGERGSTISKATVNGAASLLRALADKLAWFVEYRETAEHTIQELKAEVRLRGEQLKRLLGERDTARGELEAVKIELDASLSAQGVLLRERDVLRAEVEAGKRHGLAAIHAEEVRKLRNQFEHEVRECMSRGQTILALRRELEESRRAHEDSIRSGMELRQQRGEARQELAVAKATAENLGRQIDELRFHVRDADAAANRATEKLTTLEAECKQLRKMWGQQRATIEKYQQGERATRAEGGEPSETAGMHVPVTAPGVSLFDVFEVRLDDDWQPEAIVAGYTFDPSSVVVFKVGGTD